MSERVRRAGPPLVEPIGDLAVIRPALGPAAAAFTTRAGGQSAAPYASLNLGAGSGDDPATVAANGRCLAAALGFPYEGLARLRQVHGAAVAVVSAPAGAGAEASGHREGGPGRSPGGGWDPRPDAGLARRGAEGGLPAVGGADGGREPLGACDAAVTDRPGVALLVLAADCVPVLLVDPRRPAVGAVHAGWRGVVADAPGAAVRALADAYGSRPGQMRAAIGPCVGPCCYEVDGPVAEAFAAAGLPFEPPVARAAAPRDGRPRWRLDLAAAVRRRLEGAGLAPSAIEAAGLCTACRADLFFSHRRDGARTGRQAGVIWLPEAAP